MKNLFLLIAFLPLFAIAQQKQLTGTLKNNEGRPVTQAAVTLRNSAESVVNYSVSDAEGRFSISITDTLTLISMYLEVNILGYKRVRQQLIPGKYNYHFVLAENVIDLKEVQIKSRPQLTSKGDTLNYDVSSFAREDDRNIGDVMKRMPGLTVAENGEIYFNGKAITNMHIDDDDLMDGRYGLATRTITKDMIKSVEVIQHYQPVKVLRDKVFTDDVVVNLVLKDENSLKLSGQAMLGGGFPEQFDGAFNTIVLSRKFKMLNTLKANNSGVDFRDDFNKLGNSGLSGNMANIRPTALLSAGTTGNPDLPRRNYYLNTSGVVNINNLVNRRSGLQLRSNIQAFIDKNTMNYSSSVENYLPSGTIRYNELQQAIVKPFVVNTSFAWMLNKDNYFLDNVFRFNVNGEEKNSFMDQDGNTFNQHLRNRTYDISNELNWTPKLRNKDIMEIKWYLNYYNNPQHLFVGAGLNSDILNNNVPYQAIGQYAGIPSLFNHISAAYRINSLPVRQNYQFGVLNEWQQLNSTLYLIQTDNSVINYAGDAGNALQWQRNKFYVTASYNIGKEKWDASLSVPLSYQTIHYSQQEYSLEKQKDQYLINPVLRLKVFFNAEDYLVASYSYNNNIGNIAGVYRGTVLSNYRSLRANNAALQEQQSSGTGINYTFQRSIIMLFANAGISYNKVTANTILSSVLTDNVQRTILLPYENDQSMLTANAGASKFIFALNTSLSVKASWMRSKYNQFINTQRLPFNNDALMLNAGIESKLFGGITLSYNGTGTWNKSRQIGAADNLTYSTERYDQNVNLGYSPLINLFLNVQGRHIYSTQANAADINYLFLDTKIRYKLAKWRTDVEFDLTNMLNVKNYEIFSLNASQSAASKYAIRGMMGMLRATFAL